MCTCNQGIQDEQHVALYCPLSEGNVKISRNYSAIWNQLCYVGLSVYYSKLHYVRMFKKLTFHFIKFLLCLNRINLTVDISGQTFLTILTLIYTLQIVIISVN